MMAKFCTIVPVAVILLTSVVVGIRAEKMKCIHDGDIRKEYSSPEDSGYVECHPWKNNTCCTANFTQLLKMSQTRKLYNFDWHHCGHTKNLSNACEQYIKEEECFYSCEPSLVKFQAGKGAVNGVPVCADYCDSWFDACKDDLTCAKNWETDFNMTGGAYTCRSDSQCKTFKEVYGNGEGLCNLMWGKSFKYEKDTENCMKMWFKGANPNTDVSKKVDSGVSALKLSLALICLSVLMQIMGSCLV